ncbi:MAG: penicillin-binding transpeptidase domain-containing protein [Aquisalimonadaceae bacterium]
MTKAQDQSDHRLSRWRYAVVLLAFGLLAGALLARAVDLQVLRKDFLQIQGDARHLRTMTIPAHRGMFTDRTGKPLAISTPVESVWAHPGNLLTVPDRLADLAQALGMSADNLLRRLEGRQDKEFVYLQRHVSPEVSSRAMALGLPGVAVQREYRRFYPSGEVAGHLLGFTDIDDVGLEGLELAYESWLRGTPGSKRILRDRIGRVVGDVEHLQEPRPGRDLALSIDRRLQYMAYRELKSAVRANGALGGSLVLLDAKTGEVLAMVNQPAFNPNNRRRMASGAHRNRAVTDSFEPGSTIKPFTVGAALEVGSVQEDELINTHPGTLRVGGHTVRDIRDYGRIDVSTVISKSSNVGAAKLALEMPEDALWNMLTNLGFGRSTGSGFPGESPGAIASRAPRSTLERATLAFGYGVATTPLQLAQAYSAIATDGQVRPVSYVRLDEAPSGQQLMRPETARILRGMMEAAVADGGTAVRAQVPAYRVAGKTGTVRKSGAGGYTEDNYVAWFAGMAPASDPRLVMVVMIDEPAGEAYYGGQIAAPVFANVMSGALRLLNIAPDDLRNPPRFTAMGRGQ